MAWPFTVSHGASCHYLAPAASGLVTFDCSAIHHDRILQGWDWPLVCKTDMSRRAVSNEGHTCVSFSAATVTLYLVSVITSPLAQLSSVVCRRWLVSWVQVLLRALRAAAEPPAVRFFSQGRNFQNKSNNSPL